MSQTGIIYRRNDLDLLKGIAILAVVLYHMGVSRSGYLGVDVFFVINGYLIIPNMVNAIGAEKFKYLSFLEKRIVRLLPLMLLASLVSLFVGYWGMLPDDYENLSESVIATNFFSNNILASITTKNYWNIANEYRALMHTWYIGVLFEFYLLCPILVMLVKGLSKKFHFAYDKYVVMTIITFTVVSVLLYLNPSVNPGNRFYLLYYRFFELSSGGLVGLWIVNHRRGKLYSNGLLSGIGFVILSLIIFAGIINIGGSTARYNIVSGTAYVGKSFISQNILLLMTVLMTIFILASDNMQSRIIKWLANKRIVCILGLMSYSIFIWHQPILAFYRYFYSNVITLQFLILYFIAVIVLSYITYLFVEKNVKVCTRTRIVLLLTFLLTNGIASAIYAHAGVVRDVPELDIRMDNAHRQMHAQYVDRIYDYNADFPIDNAKINVLVVGNSYARDWANVLLESEMANKINLSYIYRFNRRYVERIKQADYVFVFNWKHNVPYYVWENVKNLKRVWGIGTKSFGECNGIIYKNRHKANYYQQTININPNFLILNRQMKEEWTGNYIDLLGLSVVNGKGLVRVFSKDGKFLSQDTNHLTINGAKFFAEIIDFKKIFD